MSENISDLPEWAQKHIRDLRSEAAENRQAVKDAATERDTLREQLHAKAAAEALESVRSLMADPEDLTRFIDAAELLGEDGAPDPAKYEAQAKALIESKPHLGKRAGRSGNGVGGPDFGHEVGGSKTHPRTNDTDAQIQAGQSDFIQAVRGQW